MGKENRFWISFTKKVVFKDQLGGIQKIFEVGDKIEATHDTGRYFVTSWGGIYHSEAELI